MAGSREIKSKSDNPEGVVFVDDLPPANQNRGGGSWAKKLAPLRENPGKWARLPGDYNSGVASMIRNGKTSGAEPGEFEAATRSAVEGLPKLKDGRVYIFVRYVGEDA